jgi:hypothetical protein
VREGDTSSFSRTALQTAEHELHTWLQNTWDDPGLPTPKTDEILNSGEYLAEFLWIVEQAREGDLQMQTLVTQMLNQAGTESVQALLGLQYAELQHPMTGRISETLRRQLKSLIIFDMLTWLANSDELRQALQNLENLPARLATLANVLKSLQLPQQRDINSPIIARTIELLESSTVGITAQATNGLQALLAHTSWDQATMLDLLENIPSVNLQAFLHTMTFINPAHLEMWEAQALKELAKHPAALAFIREGGSDLMNIAFRYTGNSWETFELFLTKLAVKRMQMGNPIDYQWFLNRMKKGEAAAFAEVTSIDLHAA